MIYFNLQNDRLILLGYFFKKKYPQIKPHGFFLVYKISINLFYLKKT